MFYVFRVSIALRRLGIRYDDYDLDEIVERSAIEARSPEYTSLLIASMLHHEARACTRQSVLSKWVITGKLDLASKEIRSRLQLLGWSPRSLANTDQARDLVASAYQDNLLASKATCAILDRWCDELGMVGSLLERRYRISKY